MSMYYLQQNYLRYLLLHLTATGVQSTSFLLSGRSRSPTRSRSFSVSRSPLRPCKHASIPIPSLNPPYILQVFSSISPCFLALVLRSFLSFPLRLSCISHSSPRTLHLLDFLLHPSTLSPRRYPTLFQRSPFCYFLPYSSISYGRQPFFLARSFLCIAVSTFVTSIIVSLREAIVNRTYGIHKKEKTIYLTIFTNSIWSY